MKAFCLRTLLCVCSWSACISLRRQKDAHSLVSQTDQVVPFCLAGATGDNALRKGGVYHGLFEAWAGSPVQMQIFAMINGRSEDTWDAEASKHKQNVIESVQVLYDSLNKNLNWRCARGDCSPARFAEETIKVVLAEDRDPETLSKQMEVEFTLSKYKDIILFLSLPPKFFGTYAQAAQNQWGTDANVHIVAEKPFGTNVDNAEMLYDDIKASGIAGNNIHLVDHFLALWMMRTMAEMKTIAMSTLNLTWDSKSFSRIAFVQGEGRGLGGRGAFFDTVGQGRDMVQSHLLQVMAATLASAEAVGPAAKLKVLQACKVKACDHGQYDGYLEEDRLSWHGDFADPTYIDVELGMEEDTAWSGVDIRITTAKAMEKNQYGIYFTQRDGKGTLAFEIGQHKFGRGGISVKNWPLSNTDSFDAPMPGVGLDMSSKIVAPNVDADGSGYILKYELSKAYFPSAYAVLMQALLEGKYAGHFVTWEECLQMWNILTPNQDKSICLDPPPARVKVYKQGLAYGQSLPSGKTVADLYDKDFKCSKWHNRTKGKTSLYQNKCCGGGECKVRPKRTRKRRVFSSSAPKKEHAVSNPTCCKCKETRSDGTPVYGCSQSGTCRFCKPYGGQKRASKISGAGVERCVQGVKGQHYACRHAFEKL